MYLSDDMGNRPLFLAGERVAPGLYCQIDGAREVRLQREDTLPASLDGRVACYVRLECPEGQNGHRIRASSDSGAEEHIPAALPGRTIRS